MKSKTLFRIGAALIALSMLGTVSAFAADGAVNITKVTVATTGDLTAEYTTDSTDQNTYLVFGGGNAAEALNDPANVVWTGVEIFDIDQLSDKKTVFKLKNGDKPSTLYLGIGGSGVTADFVAVNMTETIQSIVQPESTDTAWAAKTVLKGQNDNKITLPTTVKASVLPTGYSPNAQAVVKEYNIASWKVGETSLEMDGSTVDISSLDAAEDAYTFTPVVTGWGERNDLPTVSVTVKDKIQLSFKDSATTWSIPTEAKAYVDQYQTAAEVAAALASKAVYKQQFTADQLDVGKSYAPVTVSFEWEEDSNSPYANAVGEYTFTATKAVYNKVLPDGVSFVPPTADLPTVTIKVQNLIPLNITGVDFTETPDTIEADTSEDADFKLKADQAQGTDIDDIQGLPTALKVTEVAEGGTVLTENNSFEITGWDTAEGTPAYNAEPDVDTTYILVPVADVHYTDTSHIYTLPDDLLPKVKVTVKGKPQITKDMITQIAAIDAGTAGDEALNEDAVKAELRKLVIKATVNGNEVTLTASNWTCTDEGGYNAEVAKEYTFTATLANPEGYILADDAKSITVKVKVKDAAPTNVPYGDVNGDGRINNNDALAAWRIFAKKATLSDYAKGDYAGYDDTKMQAIVDVNGDNRINNTDALLIWRYFAKKIDKFPVEN